MKINPLPTIERICELLSYNSENGELRWRISRGSRAKIGALVYTAEGDGYIAVGIDGHSYKAHRIAWALHYREPPAGQIDHIDGDRKNNRINNLRAASHSENCCNSAPRSASGYKGVSFDQGRGRWYAYIKIAGRMKNLGRHSTAEDAAKQYDAAAIAAFGNFARLNFPIEANK